jgi:hypothetical protein
MPFIIALFAVFICIVLAVLLWAKPSPRDYIVLYKDKRIKTMKHFGYMSLEVEWYLILEDVKTGKQYNVPCSEEKWSEYTVGEVINVTLK